MEENREFDRRIRDILPEGENIKTFLEKCNPNTKNTVEEKIAAYKLWAERVFGFTIEWFHEEWVGMYLRHDRSCVMAPRQHGKTTVLAIVFPLWISFFGKNKSFLIVSNVMDHSTHIIEEIRHHIFDNELLHLMRPSHRGEMAWTRTKIVTNKDCTILCRPYRYNIKGGTYDFVLCDEASLFKDHDIFFRAICPTVIARKGHIMVIGTPESELDLLYELKLKSEHDDSTYVFKKYQAVLEDGSPLWPVKYPKDHLVKVKENDGSIQFMREYMCEMVDEGTQAFPPKLIVKAFDLSQRLRSSPLADHIYFIGSDLALSPQGDYIVHLVLAKAPDGRLLITDIQRSRGRGGSEYATQVDAVENLYKTYNAVKCSIDRSLYGDILINALKTERHVPAEGVDFHPEARNTMINNLLRLFENGRIVIPRDENDAETIRQTDTLISELSKFILSTTRSNQRTYMSIGKHDDTVMALAMAAWSADQQRKFMAYMRAV